MNWRTKEDWMTKGTKVTKGGRPGLLTNVVEAKVGDRTVVLRMEIQNAGVRQPWPANPHDVDRL